MLSNVTLSRFSEITSCYASLRLALVGDFCLDRYLEIDPTKTETSIETGLPVHNVVRVRSQPGGAGTILNNLCALGIGELYPVGFCGDDGEGYELLQAFNQMPGVKLEAFIKTPLRRTFTYCKPLFVAPEQPPVELNRLDSKNWSPTPAQVESALINRFRELSQQLKAVILLDQVDVPETGVLTKSVLAAVGECVRELPHVLVVGDSRRGMRGWPLITSKMNLAELCALTGLASDANLTTLKESALTMAKRNNRMVFITLSERGILGAAPNGQVEHVPCHPLRGPIDIVGAGDAVTANLTAALAAGATLREAIEIANAAASVVIHQLGTTGTASVSQIRKLLFS